MAQNVSELWGTLWSARNTEREYAFDIDGVWYDKDKEVEHKAESSLYSDFGIGNATASSLSLGLFADNIPRAAKIKRFIRLVNGDQITEWIPKGVFFANTRANDDGYWTVEAVDAMRKADAVWEPDQSLVFPMPMTEAVETIAALMGVEIDPRTNLNPAYTIDYPVSNQTLRKTLAWIAAANGGNFIISDAGKLWLRPLISAPAETNYLVTETGSPILVGGMKIIVDDAASGLGNADGSKFYVGLDITGFSNNGKYKPVSRVTLLLDDENALTAGDDTGFEIVADCPYATQKMVDALLAQLKGYVYQAYEADEANIDPIAELGDGVTVSGIYSVIGRIVDDGEGYPSLSAPGEAELEGDLPPGGPMTQEFNRKIAETYSLITKTAEEIRLEVENEMEGLSSSLTAELNSIRAEVTGVEDAISYVELDLESITGRVQDAEGNISALQLTTERFTTQIRDVEGDLSILQQTADRFYLQLEDAEDSISQMLYMDASSGFIFSNQTGRQVTINGGQVELDTLIGSNVYFKDRYGQIAADFAVTGASSTAQRKLVLSSGAFEVATYGGSIFLSSTLGPQLLLGRQGTSGAVYCQLSGGPLVIGADSYGKSLPSTGTYGQVFFLLE